MNLRKYVAELVGTFVLVAFGCMVGVLLRVDTPAGYIGTALAFGLTIVAMAYSVGNISGCHVNPAVSFAMFLAKKLTLKDFLFYVLFQVVGAILGGFVVALFSGSLTSVAATTVSDLLVTNYGATPALFVGLAAETILTFVFVFAILGVTSKQENSPTAGLVIGLSLTLVHLAGIGLTGSSVNPARSLGSAVVASIGGDFVPLSQIWLYVVGPLLGAALAYFVYSFLVKKPEVKA